MDDRPALHSRRSWLPVLVALALMAGLGGWIGWQWHVQEQRSKVEQEQRFTFAVDDIEHTLRERMRAHQEGFCRAAWAGSRRGWGRLPGAGAGPLAEVSRRPFCRGVGAAGRAGQPTRKPLTSPPGGPASARVACVR